jgi:hypothetical protein
MAIFGDSRAALLGYAVRLCIGLCGVGLLTLLSAAWRYHNEVRRRD